VKQCCFFEAVDGGKNKSASPYPNGSIIEKMMEYYSIIVKHATTYQEKCLTKLLFSIPLSLKHEKLFVKYERHAG